MNTENFPHNGLPKALTDIPFGEIFILTNPALGITSKNIFMMQFIFSMARQYGQVHVVNALPVEYSGLWDCFICKVETDEGAQILVADKDSLVEMLCEFWGLDFDEVCGTVTIPKRNKDVSLTAHPMRIHLKPERKNEPVVEKDAQTTTLGFLTSHTKEKALDNLRATILDNFNYNLAITLDEIVSLYGEIEKKRKTYTLDIQIEKQYGENGKPIRIKKCDVSLIDNFGGRHPLKIEVQAKAIYALHR